VDPDWGEGELKARGLDGEKERNECIVGTTLGHAGVMVQVPLEGTMILGGKGPKGDGGKERLWVVFDPIFSARAGPTQYTGPGRLRRAPCQVEDFPGKSHSKRIFPTALISLSRGRQFSFRGE